MTGLEYVMFVKGVTSTLLAEDMGVSTQLVHHWLKGNRNINEDRLKYLEKRFGISRTYLGKELDARDRLAIDVVLLKDEGVSVDDELVAVRIELANMKNNYARLLAEYNGSVREKEELKNKIIETIKSM